MLELQVSIAISDIVVHVQLAPVKTIMNYALCPDVRPYHCRCIKMYIVNFFVVGQVEFLIVRATRGLDHGVVVPKETALEIQT